MLSKGKYKHSDLVSHWYEGGTLIIVLFDQVMLVVINLRTRNPLCTQIILSFTTCST